MVKAKELGVNTSDKEALCKDQKILDFIRSEVNNVTKDKIARFEEIKKFVLLPNEFSLEKNEITPTLKLKRKVIGKNYSAEIESMYEAAEVSV